MAETTTAATTKSPKKTPKAKKPQPKPTHPSYKSMVQAAVKNLKEKSGSSRQAILKYIVANYKVDAEKANRSVRFALNKGVSSGDLRQVKGTGASGSFRLAKDEFGTGKRGRPATKKATKPKKPAKKTTVKKTTAAKKTAVKKATKPKKKTTTKVSAKSAPKKPAAKKTTPKKAASKKAPKKVTKK